MTEIEQHFLDELLFCINENDLQKSYALLQFIPTMRPEIQNRALFEISNANDSLSYAMFEYLVRVQIADVEVRNKLYELILDKGRVNNEFYYIYIRMADEKELEEAVPVLLDILTTETNIGILMETIRSLASIKSQSAITALNEFIYYNDEMLKREAVMALEKIGGPAARQSLEFAANTSKSSPMIISSIDRLRKAENLPKFVVRNREINLMEDLPVVEEAPKEVVEEKKTVEETEKAHEVKKPEKTDKEIEIEIPDEIRELLEKFNSGVVEQRHEAIDTLIEMGEDSVSAVVSNMDHDNPDNLINSLDILGNIGSKTAAPPIMKIINLRHEDSNVRFASFEALERLPKLKSALVLSEGITDSSEQVRIAAASAIDKNLSDVLIAGLKSKIDPGDATSKIVIESIIDAKAANTFEKLLESDAFTFGFSNYLTHDAAPEIREFYIDLLKKRGNRALAGRIDFDTQKDRVKDRKVIYAVDDSRIMLNFYIKKIYKMGHTPRVFLDPNKALEMMIKSKPALLITDLNMLEITGLQFAETIREIYPASLLPIVIVTTQKDFFEKTVNKDPETVELLEKIGIAKTLRKPLDPANLDELLEIDDNVNVFSEYLCTLSSEIPEIRYKSLQKVTEIAKSNVKDILDKVMDEETDLTVNKLRIVSGTGGFGAFELINEYIKKKPKNPNLRFSLFDAYYNTVPADFEVESDFVDYIEDTADHVRIAVARILNKKPNEQIMGKLKEMIETGSRSARSIVASIIDSRSENLFRSLLSSDAFTYVVSDYLARSAHPSHREFFLSVLKNRGNNSLLRSIEREVEEAPLNMSNILVVEDLESMQDYFLSKFHSAGFKVTAIDDPENIMSVIFAEKPDLIVTSFGLPGISGLTLTENIRKDLPPEDLPIVMVTKQSDFVNNSAKPDSVFKQHFAPKGIDRIFMSPLKNKDIEVIRSLVS